jgi:3D (Asp-Asp-Asp) domain-containing protein
MATLYRAWYDPRVRLAPVLVLLLLGTSARADDSKLRKEDVVLQPKQIIRGKDKLCCGYPLVEDQQWALRFYWLTLEGDYDDPPPGGIPKGGACAIPANRWVEMYTPEGFFFGRVPERFACSLRLEGSGLMKDGRIVNYTGSCKYGYGTCFEQLDVEEHPFGRGSGLRPLIPFKSVAVDPRLVPIGEPLYIPEFDGLVLPDGSIHDGCVRADDTGGGIKKRKMDFFVVTYGNFRFLLDELLNVSWITPHIQAPRCEYLRDL